MSHRDSFATPSSKLSCLRLSAALGIPYQFSEALPLKQPTKTVHGQARRFGRASPPKSVARSSGVEILRIHVTASSHSDPPVVSLWPQGKSRRRHVVDHILNELEITGRMSDNHSTSVSQKPATASMTSQETVYEVGQYWCQNDSAGPVGNGRTPSRKITS